MNEPSRSRLLSAVVDLRNPDRTVRQRAIRIISRSRAAHVQTPDVISALADAMSDPRAEIRAELALLLSRLHLGRDALLRHARADEAELVRLICLTCLRDQDRSATSTMVEALADPSEKVVDLACGRLAAMRYFEAAPQIRTLLQHPSWRIRRSACEALLSLDRVDEDVLRAAEALQSSADADDYDHFVASSRLVEAVEPTGLASKTYTVAELVERVRDLIQERSTSNGTSGPPRME